MFTSIQSVATCIRKGEKLRIQLKVVKRENKRSWSDGSNTVHIWYAILLQLLLRPIITCMLVTVSFIFLGEWLVLSSENALNQTKSATNLSVILYYDQHNFRYLRSVVYPIAKSCYCRPQALMLKALATTRVASSVVNLNCCMVWLRRFQNPFLLSGFCIGCLSSSCWNRGKVRTCKISLTGIIAIALLQNSAPAIWGSQFFISIQFQKLY